MPKLPPGVKKKTSTESSLAYIARQKARLGDDVYKEHEAERQRAYRASLKLHEDSDHAEHRKKLARERAARFRAKKRAEKLAAMRGSEPDAAANSGDAVTAPVRADSGKSKPKSSNPLIVSLDFGSSRKGRKTDSGSGSGEDNCFVSAVEYPVHGQSYATHTVEVNEPRLQELSLMDDGERSIRKTRTSAQRRSGSTCRTRRQTQVDSVFTTQDCVSSAVEELCRETSGDAPKQIKLKELSNSPRKRNKERDRAYYKARKLKEKLEEEKAAFLAEQTKNNRCRRRAEDVLDLVHRNISRIKSKKQRKKAIHMFATATEIRGKRLGAELGRMFNLTSRSILYANKGRVKQKYTKSQNTWHLMMWLQDPEHSITCAGKKEKVVCRYHMDGKVIKVEKQKVILTERLKTLHAVYAARFPERKCSLTFFQNVRRDSQFIKTLDHARIQVCLCQKHQNFALKMRAIRKFCKLSDNPDVLVREYTPDQFETTLKPFTKHLPPIIRYEEWKLTPIPYLDPKIKKSIKKLRPVPLEMPRVDFVKMLIREYPGISKHVQLATQQHRTVRQLRANLKPGEATIQMDFAQNWLIGYGEEIQSGFFAKDPITVHPAVIHVRVGDEVKIVSLVLATDDRRHDSGAILAIIDQICVYLKLHYPFVHTVHYWSDSPSSQYRNISMFSIICRHVERYGINCTWSYFESGHGKGPCDGIGAVAKRIAELALKMGKNILCAKDFVDNGNASGGEVFYILVRVVDCYANRDLLKYFVTPRKVPGTMTIHNVMVTKAGTEIVTRQLSCYLECCWDVTNLCPVVPQLPCKTHSQWCKWSRVELYNSMIHKKLDKLQRALEEKQAEEDAVAETSVNARAAARNAAVETFEKGDYVAAVWGRDWWVAVVCDVLVLDEYMLKFMHPVQTIDTSIGLLESDTIYVDWPPVEDVLPLRNTKILCAISKPKKTHYEGMDCYTLPQREVQTIDYLYQNFSF